MAIMCLRTWFHRALGCHVSSETTLLKDYFKIIFSLEKKHVFYTNILQVEKPEYVL